MKPTYKTTLMVLMAFHMLWGLVLWFSISKYGLGISTDSVHFLFSALNLSEGRGLLSFDGGFALGWPPLYSVLVALVHLITGFDAFVSATILQGVSFIGLSLCLSVLSLKIFPGNFLLALASNILSDVGAVVVYAFAMVGSDYVHLFLVTLMVLLTGYYLERQSPRLFVAMCATGMLAMLLRYLGIAAIATGAFAILFSKAWDLRERIVRSVWMALSAFPAAAWYLAVSPLVHRRLPIDFSSNFSWFSKSVLEWFLPAQTEKAHLTFSVAFPWIFIGCLILLLARFSRRNTALTLFATTLFIYGIFYALALFGSASLVYFNKLGGRFLLPLYIPFVTLLVVAVDVLSQRASGLKSRAARYVASTVLVGTLALVAGGLLRITVPVLLQSHSNGALDENAFNTRAWRENSAIDYWLKHQPQGEYVLLSNYPDGIAFYTWHACSASPRRFSGPYGVEEFPVIQYASELFSSGRDVYVVWIEPNAYPYYYNIAELSPIAQIQPLFVSRDGGVYRLRPAQPPRP